MATRHTRLDAEQWRKLINEQPHTDLSIDQFCHRKGVGISTFLKWRRRFGDKSLISSDQPQSNFVQVVAHQQNQPGILLKVSDSLCVEFPIDVPANTVADIVQAVSTRIGR